MFIILLSLDLREGCDILSLKINVVDNSGRPRVNYSVHVSWRGGGFSSGRTDSNGNYDTGVKKGTISKVTVEGRTVGGSMAVDSSHQFMQVTYG